MPNRMCLCVFVLVLQSGASCPAASQFRGGCWGKDPMKSLCVMGTYKPFSPLAECNLPENLLTKRYIISGAPKYNPWPIWPLYRTTFSQEDLQPEKVSVCVKGEWTKGGTQWEPSLRHMGTSFNIHFWKYHSNTSLDFLIQICMLC